MGAVLTTRGELREPHVYMSERLDEPCWAVGRGYRLCSCATRPFLVSFGIVEGPKRQRPKRARRHVPLRDECGFIGRSIYPFGIGALIGLVLCILFGPLVVLALLFGDQV